MLARRGCSVHELHCSLRVGSLGHTLFLEGVEIQCLGCRFLSGIIIMLKTLILAFGQGHGG